MYDKIPALSYMKKYVINIHAAQSLDLDELKGKLVDLGYEKLTVWRSRDNLPYEAVSWTYFR